MTSSFVGTEEPDDASKHNDCPAEVTPTDAEDASGAAGGAAVAPPRWAPVGSKSSRSLRRPRSPRAQPRRPKPKQPGAAAAGRESLMPIKVVCSLADSSEPKSAAEADADI